MKTLGDELKKAISDMKGQRDLFRKFEYEAEKRFNGLLSVGHISQPKTPKYVQGYRSFTEQEIVAKTKFQLAMNLLAEAYVAADNALFLAEWDRGMYDLDEKERLHTEEVEAELHK